MRPNQPVEAKIEEQAEFVEWWQGAVRGAGNPEQKSQSLIIAELRQLTRADAEDLTGITHKQVSRWRKRLDDRCAYRDSLYGVAWRRAMAVARAEGAHLAYNSDENEWYTPQVYIEAAREVMGSIDLDPASSETANAIVGAAQFYDRTENGLSKEWYGRVWMNPPYAASLVAGFTAKLARHYVAGDVSEAVVLVNNATETLWFQELADHASALCLVRGRVRFLSQKGRQGAPLQGQVILYLGVNHEGFAEKFKQFGLVWNQTKH